MFDPGGAAVNGARRRAEEVLGQAGSRSERARFVTEAVDAGLEMGVEHARLHSEAGVREAVRVGDLEVVVGAGARDADAPLDGNALAIDEGDLMGLPPGRNTGIGFDAGVMRRPAARPVEPQVGSNVSASRCVRVQRYFETKPATSGLHRSSARAATTSGSQFHQAIDCKALITSTSKR